MRLAKALLALPLLASVACSDQSLPTAAAPSAPRFIIGGELTGSSFGNVGAVLYDFGGDGVDADDWYCTGSLISTTVFLTAAHCLEFLPAGAQVYVSFDPDMGAKSRKLIAARAFHYDPLFPGTQNDPHDIGVVILPSDKTKGIAPLSLPPAGYLDGLAAQNGLKDQLFVNVGYGGDATASGIPTISYDGVRKVSKSPFQALENFWLVLNMNGNATGEGGDCYGDSGGPKFLDGNTTMVVATVVTGDVPCRATSKDYRLDTRPARAFLGQFVPLP